MKIILPKRVSVTLIICSLLFTGSMIALYIKFSQHRTQQDLLLVQSSIAISLGKLHRDMENFLHTGDTQYFEEFLKDWEALNRIPLTYYSHQKLDPTVSQEELKTTFQTLLQNMEEYHRMMHYMFNHPERKPGRIEIPGVPISTMKSYFSHLIQQQQEQVQRLQTETLQASTAIQKITFILIFLGGVTFILSLLFWMSFLKSKPTAK